MNKESLGTNTNPFKRLIPRGIGSDPYTDWPIMIAVSAVAALSLVYIGYSTYASVGDSLATGASRVSARANAGFDQASLAKLKSARAATDAARKAALSGYAGPADPSR